ncbi:hypothetical protein tinsulaeT_35730 [Thalassotalea insulae]|uniref:Uncharacterized protein n=1 Tax=Thalassotalea insulae TaxID=2056778 RepID=A0ABQ6GWE4_9GAMM|nr:hypothetical protein [Thalassotalea insulae]GLX80233.1 hypothetical protein tinsulaeT_35730 [Thalassotalea insulae]
MKDILEIIDKDINDHRKDASNMLLIIFIAFITFLILLFLTFAPDIANKLLSEERKALNENKLLYASAVSDYKKRYKDDFEYISNEKYSKLIDEGKITEKHEDALKISRISPINEQDLQTLKLISHLSLNEKKIESIFQLLTLIFGAVFGGCLLTYRTHAISSKELSLKKMDFLIEYKIDNKAEDTRLASISQVDQLKDDTLATDIMNLYKLSPNEFIQEVINAKSAVGFAESFDRYRKNNGVGLNLDIIKDNPQPFKERLNDYREILGLNKIEENQDSKSNKSLK